MKSCPRATPSPSEVGEARRGPGPRAALPAGAVARPGSGAAPPTRPIGLWFQLRKPQRSHPGVTTCTPPPRGLPGHPWRRRLGLAKEKSGFALLPNPGCQHLPTTLVPASSKAKPFGAWRGASRSCDSTLISHPARVLLSVCGSAPPLVPAKLL